MRNFNKLDNDTKAFLHLFMMKAAANVGGANFLLSLIEAMKAKKPSPLMLKEKQVSSNNTTIRWNKIIFKDKVDVIESILQTKDTNEERNLNILDIESEKKKKIILNAVKTLAPIEFTVTPQNPNDGDGFSFKAFETLEENNVKINPIFVAMFFCSTEFTKKALKYEA